MGFLKRKQKGYLGIDFGAGGIKVVQLQPVDGRGKLFTYGFAERGLEEVGIDYLDQPDATSDLLKKICAKARITTTQAVAALPIPSVFSAVLSIADVPKKELLQAVQWEAKKLIPLPLEEVVLDYKELAALPSSKEGKQGKEKEEKKEKSIQVLLTAAPKGIIDKYLQVAKQAGLTLSSIETEAFAIIRSLVGTDPVPAVVVDIGAVRSNILIIDRGIPMLTRSVQIGGKKCTEALAVNLGLKPNQAEAMKRDLDANTELPPVLKDVLQPLLNELKYSFNVYRTRNAVVRPPEKIILTGGGAGTPGIAKLLAAEFNLRTFLGDPWDQVDFNKDLTHILQTMGSRFAVSIGLALRNL